MTALKFANSKTRWRLVASPGDGWSTLDRAGTEDDDITEGTNPPGSAWRPVGKETVGGGYAIRQLSCVLRSLVISAVCSLYRKPFDASPGRTR